LRHYELVVVLSPMLNQEEVSQTWDKIKGFISTREAEISHEEQWGTRRLAYPIRKGQHRFLEGSYHLTRFATEKAFNIELENFLKVDDEVLRSLVTVTLPEEELAAQAAAAARAIRTPPPPRPAVDPDVTQLPAEGAAPAAAPTAEGAAPTPASDAPVAETVTEAPTAETAAEAPAAEADPAPEASVEAEESAAAEEPEAASEAEEEPTAPEGGDNPAEESEEPASEPDDSEE